MLTFAEIIHEVRFVISIVSQLGISWLGSLQQIAVDVGAEGWVVSGDHITSPFLTFTELVQVETVSSASSDAVYFGAR